MRVMKDPGNEVTPSKEPFSAPASKEFVMRFLFVSFEDAQKDPFFQAPNSSWNANREFFNVLCGF